MLYKIVGKPLRKTILYNIFLQLVINSKLQYLTDELKILTQEQKENTFLRILEKHSDRIQRICWGFSSKHEDVEDIYQNVLLNIWRGLNKFEGRSEIATWIHRICINSCLLWKRKEKKLMEKATLNESTFGLSVEEQFIKNEKIVALHTAIQTLNKMDKSIALLILEECSYKEIADVTGLTVTNVGVKINRIKKQLKKKLENK